MNQQDFLPVGYFPLKEYFYCYCNPLQGKAIHKVLVVVVILLVLQSATHLIS
ncbi:hypothetical protein EMUCRT_0528 [Ehrlichia cf. muris str. EmCRT]|uniref:Uncharacterized protein n=1 Tax=Ehrlichia cf. muris str. EmCRT TaxID=1359167 RepID=A0A0F3NBZ2_9RICK|nr:hypothetical protein EMUCRT_0528 [Ehrlichia cf. muris str. EmCRT]